MEADVEVTGDYGVSRHAQLPTEGFGHKVKASNGAWRSREDSGGVACSTSNNDPRHAGSSAGSKKRAQSKSDLREDRLSFQSAGLESEGVVTTTLRLFGAQGAQ